jgi:hypothetical protein
VGIFVKAALNLAVADELLAPECQESHNILGVFRPFKGYEYVPLSATRHPLNLSNISETYMQIIKLSISTRKPLLRGLNHQI